MDYFTLVLFDSDDAVVSVKTVAARDNDAANGIARIAQMVHPDCIGYQLWRSGERVAKTYPADKVLLRQKTRANGQSVN